VIGPSDFVPPAEIERAWADETGEPIYHHCCAGAALRGIDHCTCWEPIFDLEQEPLQEGPAECRSKCCHDCAYRNGSPKRADDHGTEHLLDVAAGARSTFWCHQGVRRVVAWRHPDGRELPAGDGDYRPPMERERGRIWRADGRPGQLCAGWAAHRPATPDAAFVHRTFADELPEWVG
jgi:hypothetical protein